MYGTVYMEALAKLILFMLEGLLIGLVIRIPFVKLNHFVEERMKARNSCDAYSNHVNIKRKAPQLVLRSTE